LKRNNRFRPRFFIRIYLQQGQRKAWRKLTNCLKNIELNKTGKFYFYSTILGKFELQKYLEFPLAKELRSLLTKLRISAHSLAIETGRYNNTLKEQCFCKHCPTSVENESHFILYCSRFAKGNSRYF
jgi:hypothetical protein